MCDPTPGVRCAPDTRVRAASASARYDAAYPDGPIVGPLTATAVTSDEATR